MSSMVDGNSESSQNSRFRLHRPPSRIHASQDDRVLTWLSRPQTDRRVHGPASLNVFFVSNCFTIGTDARDAKPLSRERPDSSAVCAKLASLSLLADLPRWRRIVYGTCRPLAEGVLALASHHALLTHCV
jgi:hypothetical protein